MNPLAATISQMRVNQGNGTPAGTAPGQVAPVAPVAREERSGVGELLAKVAQRVFVA